MYTLHNQSNFSWPDSHSGERISRFWKCITNSYSYNEPLVYYFFQSVSGVAHLGLTKKKFSSKLDLSICISIFSDIFLISISLSRADKHIDKWRTKNNIDLIFIDKICLPNFLPLKVGQSIYRCFSNLPKTRVSVIKIVSRAHPDASSISRYFDIFFVT